jgi:hypothetical protein
LEYTSGNEIRISIYNILGEKVKDLISNESKGQINLDSWERGLYFFHINSLNFKFSQKFIVN